VNVAILETSHLALLKVRRAVFIEKQRSVTLNCDPNLFGSLVAVPGLRSARGYGYRGDRYPTGR